MYRLAGLCQRALVALLVAAAVLTVWLRDTSPMACLAATIGLWWVLAVVVFYRAFARDRMAASETGRERESCRPHAGPDRHRPEGAGRQAP